ncbi:ATP-binding protein [Azospirillum sp. HJ39]|uniref:AAA family ATPase n=1 Tax=Azospirillum sp. HJ39 TaxID=3159496 RepID=UPI003558DD1B
MAEAFVPSHAIRRFAEVLMPEACEAPILSRPVRTAIHQWRVELGAGTELEAVGLKPRRKAMLYGPPGCGKTTLAHHLSARLGLPLVLVNAAAMISKYVGETGANVNELFDQIIQQQDRCVLFLDEFDSLCAKRMSEQSGAARNRNETVVALLQKIDQFAGTLLAATNRSDDIDPAIWRRFGMHLDILEPDDECRMAIITRYLAPFTLDQRALEVLCMATAGASPALLRQLMEGVKRDMVIAPKLKLPMDCKSVFSRLIVSVRPHADMQQPPLWAVADARSRVEAMPWPPVLPDAGGEG